MGIKSELPKDTLAGKPIKGVFNKRSHSPVVSINGVASINVLPLSIRYDERLFDSNLDAILERI